MLDITDGELLDLLAEAVGLDGYEGEHFEGGLLYCLADLIDRPTCTVENVIYRDSWEEYEVQLSCGHEIITTESADGLAFCQYCGAEVIPHAERRD